MVPSRNGASCGDWFQGDSDVQGGKATYIWKKGDSLDVAAILCLHVDDWIPWTT